MLNTLILDFSTPARASKSLFSLQPRVLLPAGAMHDQSSAAAASEARHVATSGRDPGTVSISAANGWRVAVSPCVSCLCLVLEPSIPKLARNFRTSSTSSYYWIRGCKTP